jgi:hypothetical protein
METEEEPRMVENNLWHEISLGNPLYLQVEGVLYATRMSAGRIEGHRDEVVKALQGMGMSITQEEDGFRINGHNDSNGDGAVALLDELSVLNSAADYKNAGIDSIAQLSGNYLRTWMRLSAGGNLADAYDMMSIELPQLAAGLRAADKINSPLYTHERVALDELVGLSQRKVDLMNRPRGYVIMGMSN